MGYNFKIDLKFGGNQKKNGGIPIITKNNYYYILVHLTS